MKRLLLTTLLLAGTVSSQTVTAVTTVNIDGKPQRVRKDQWTLVVRRQP